MKGLAFLSTPQVHPILGPTLLPEDSAETDKGEEYRLSAMHMSRLVNPGPGLDQDNVTRFRDLPVECIYGVRKTTPSHKAKQQVPSTDSDARMVAAIQDKVLPKA